MSFSNGPDGWRQKRKNLLAFLKANHDAVTSPELEALGFSTSGIHRLVHDDGLIVPYCRGVYRSASAGDSLESKLRCELARTRDPRAALTEQSAAHHLGYLAWAPRKVQLMVPRNSGYPDDPAVERRSRPGLDEREVFAPRGLRCARPFLIVTEMAAVAARRDSTIGELRAFKRVIRAAAKDDRMLVDRWRAALKSRPFPGGSILEHELFPDFERTLDVRSDGEVDLVDLCRMYGLPIPCTNVYVAGLLRDGWFPEEGVVVEVDTYATHGDGVSYERDHRRISSLSALGIRSFPVTTLRMRAEPAAVAAELEATLAHGRAARRAAAIAAELPNGRELSRKRPPLGFTPRRDRG